jgi:arylsulfatase A-like enzyme
VPDIHTPNIDALSETGVRFANYYVQPICSPTRAVLMTGRYSIHTGCEHILFGASEPSCVPTTLPLMPHAFKKIGYQTHMAGKWHLGYVNNTCSPWSRGFDSFLGEKLYTPSHPHSHSHPHPPSHSHAHAHAHSHAHVHVHAQTHLCKQALTHANRAAAPGYLNGVEGYYQHGMGAWMDFHECTNNTDDGPDAQRTRMGKILELCTRTRCAAQFCAHSLDVLLRTHT